MWWTIVVTILSGDIEGLVQHFGNFSTEKLEMLQILHYLWFYNKHLVLNLDVLKSQMSKTMMTQFHIEFSVMDESSTFAKLSSVTSAKYEHDMGRVMWLSCCQGAISIRKTVLPGMAIPMLKIRRLNGRLIFNMGIPIPGKDGLYIETGPWFCYQLILVGGWCTSMTWPIYSAVPL